MKTLKKLFATPKVMQIAFVFKAINWGSRPRSTNQKNVSGRFLIRISLAICLIIFGSHAQSFAQDYFQQEVNYKIHVSLNDKRHELNAFETVEYINHSPDTLHFLYFHLWPNAYSNNNTPLARQLFQIYGKEKLFNDPELRGFVDSLDFEIDGSKVQWNLLPGQPDICRINLDIPLVPGDFLFITTPFRVKIPKGVTSRLGHIGESYQISQWFPKPAVYDRLGWHQMSYLDQGEFYSEFGRYDVRITLPDNYVVGATGNLQNPEEIEVLDKLAADTARIKPANAGEADFPASSKSLKTLRYTGDKMHDFAWFADKRFHVLTGKVQLPNSGREVTTMVMFTTEQAELWKDALQYVNEAIAFFSRWIGDYPYQSFTAVQSALGSGDGMEYPGITVVGHADDAYALDEVIAHEICHNWFYGALGSNERYYPYLDEGITSAYTIRYMNEKYPEQPLWEVYIKNRKLAKFFHVEKMPVQRMQELEWLVQARSKLEQPINLPATDYSDLNYFLIIYNKAAISFNYLRAYLGDSLFDASMHSYYRDWKFKHPHPSDLRSKFEKQTDKDLSWFFEDLIGTTKSLDYRIIRFENQQLLVKNRGQMAAPLVISGVANDSVYFEKWVTGFKGRRWIEIPPGKYTELKIDPNHVMPELFRLNNNIRKSGTFRKADPLLPQLYFSVEDLEKRSVMYFPAANWTYENGFMVGMALHNGFVIPKPLQYFVLPFYAFGNSSLAGFGRVSYNITPYSKWIRMMTVSLEGTQFGAPGNQDYHTIAAGLDVYFRQRNMNTPLTQKVFGNYIAASSLYQIGQQDKAQMNSYLQLGYALKNERLINPYKLEASFELGKSYQKTSVTAKYKISYHGPHDGLDIRFFTGVMLTSDPTVSFYSFAPSGRSGNEQYLFQGTYPDRFATFPTTFWSRQMTLSEGGLVSPVNSLLGFSQWLFSLSLTSSLPGIASQLPVKPFVNFLVNDHGVGDLNRSSFFFESGLKTGVWNLFEIYVPLLVSKKIKSDNSIFKDRIRLVFTLDSFNLVKLSTRTAY